MKNKLALLGGLICVLALGFTFCKNGKSQPEVVDEKPAVAMKVPAFNRDSAFLYVNKQTEFGPRVPNTAAHQACKNWLSAKLKGYGLEVIEQNFTPTTFDGKKLNSTNIIGQYRPELSRRIVLAAHWDSRPFADSPVATGDKTKPVMGADDGASGVGVLLEIARQLQANPVDIGVDIVFFDAEDYGDGGENAKPDTWFPNIGPKTCIIKMASALNTASCSIWSAHLLPVLASTMYPTNEQVMFCKKYGVWPKKWATVSTL